MLSSLLGKRSAGKSVWVKGKRKKARYGNRTVKIDKALWARRPFRAEPKEVDVTLTLPFQVVPQAQLLNGIAVGANEYNRIGRRTEASYLRIDGFIDPTNGVVNASADLFRIAIVYDRQSNGTAPAYGDVFADTDSSGATTSTVHSHPNVDNRFRFAILKDKKFYVPSSNGGSWTGVQADTEQNLKIKWFIPLNGLVTHFSGDGAGIGPIATGSFYMFVVAAVTGVPGDVSFVGKSRFCFHDA